jgi:hypothetical protein
VTDAPYYRRADCDSEAYFMKAKAVPGSKTRRKVTEVRYSISVNLYVAYEYNNCRPTRLKLRIRLQYFEIRKRLQKLIQLTLIL